MSITLVGPGMPRTAFLVSLFVGVAALGAELQATDGDLTVESLVAYADCTEEKCPASNPCCHECSHAGWQISGDPGVEVVAGHGSLPACRPDGCGRCESMLRATGRMTGDRFVVESWEWASAPEVPSLFERRVLRVLAVCTEKACLPPDVCCNTCGFSGWGVVDSPDLEPVADSGELPTCRPDGCGQCDIELLAWGRTDGRLFRVIRWEEQPYDRPPVDPGGVILLTWEERQCIGGNGLEPGTVRRALTEAGVEVLRLLVPEYDPPICEACYPACSISVDYRIVVRPDQREETIGIVDKLRRPLADTLP